MSGWWAEILPLLAIGMMAAAQASPSCPNPAFEDGLNGWEVLDPEYVRLEHITGGPAEFTLALDARFASAPPVAQSHPFEVEEGQAYDIGGMVQRTGGYGHETFMIAVAWLDKSEAFIQQNNSWQGMLFGDEWTEYRAQVIAPKNARKARLLLSVAPGSACRMTRLFLEQASGIAPSIHIALMPEPLQEGAESQLRYRIQNMASEPLRHVLAKVTLPEGMSSPHELKVKVGTLRPWEGRAFTLPLVGKSVDAQAEFQVEVCGGWKHLEAVHRAATPVFDSIPTEIPTATAELAKPEPMRKSYQTGCWYFPSMIDWSTRTEAFQGMRSCENTKPLLGYYNEALPEVADWHVQWAARHGIDFFIFDWYYNQGYEYLNDALDEGFLKSRFREQMKFAIHWCIQQGTVEEFKPYDFSEQSLSELAELLCSRYFSQSNYLCIDGKPAFFIYQPWRLVNGLGNASAARKALDAMRGVAQAHGYAGIYFIAVHNNPWMPSYASAGFDCVTAYSFMSGDLLQDAQHNVDYAALLPEYARWFAAARERAQAQGLPYIPTAWAGWDDTPRNPKSAWRTTGNDAAAFHAMLSMLPDYIDPNLKIGLVESWNEWGEGGAIEPGAPYGFGKAAAIRNVLGSARGPYETPVPLPSERTRMQTTDALPSIVSLYQQRYAARLSTEHGISMDLSSNRSMWFIAGGPSPARMQRADGALRGVSHEGAPMLFGPPAMQLDASQVREVKISLSASAGSTGRMYWSSDEKPGFEEGRSVPFAIQADGQVHEYCIDLSAHPEWRGTITQFRLDPMNTSGEFALYSFVAGSTE